MAVTEQATKSMFIDKEMIRRIIEEQNALIGFVPDPTATVARARARMLALGIRPEDNIGSRGIIEERERRR
jgi:hypothetical protein